MGSGGLGGGGSSGGGPGGNLSALKSSVNSFTRELASSMSLGVRPGAPGGGEGGGFGRADNKVGGQGQVGGGWSETRWGGDVLAPLGRKRLSLLVMVAGLFVQGELASRLSI